MPNPEMQNNFYSSNKQNNTSNLGKLSSKEAFQEHTLGLNKLDLKQSGPDYSKMIADVDQFLKIRNEKFKKANIQRRQEEINTMNETTEEEKAKKLAAQEELDRIITNLEIETLKIIESYHNNIYKRMNAAQKVEYIKRQQEELESTHKRLDDEYDLKIASIIATDADSIALKKQLEQEKLNLDMQYMEKKAALQEETRKQESAKRFKELKVTEDNFKKFKESPNLKGALNLMVGISKVDGKRLEEMYKDSKQAYQNQKATTQKNQEEFEKWLANENLTDEERAEIQDKKDAQYKADLKKETELARQQLVTYIADSFIKGINEKFNEIEEIFSQYRGVIDARLQGSDKNFDDMMNLISSNLLLSPYIKTQKLVENMKKLADEGIAYNIEQRAFLSTISEKIANTFDAFDSNLQRLIRLQQADSTAARLGMEASLTKLFNNMFQDSSYLNSIADSVSSALIDASSTMTRDMSTAFEFQVQKWLGSLSSLGMSESTITNLAQGINYLATGDVTSLASNTQLQTLLAMSAANAGLEYSELLLKGLDASNVNKLMESMVKYLKQIAEESDNQVVRAAYGNIFNLTMSDMKAISNLTASEISNIASKTLSYSAAMSELNSQLNKVSSRTTLNEKMNNLFNNVLFNFAENIVSDPVLYPMYKILQFMKEQDIDINIPSIGAFGNFVDLEASLGDIMRGTLLAGSALKMIPDLLKGLTSGGGLNLGSWKATETTNRGTGTSFVDLSAKTSTSSSTYITSGNVTDIKSSTLSSATDEAEETSKITNKNIKKVEHTLDDIFNLFNPVIGSTKPDKYIWVQDYTIQGLIEDNSLKVKDNTVNTSIISLQERLSDNTYKVIDINRSELLNSISNLSTKLSVMSDTNTQPTEININTDQISKAIAKSLKTSIVKVGDQELGLKDIVTMLYAVIGGDKNNSIRVRPASGATFDTKVTNSTSFKYNT